MKMKHCLAVWKQAASKADACKADIQQAPLVPQAPHLMQHRAVRSHLQLLQLLCRGGRLLWCGRRQALLAGYVDLCLANLLAHLLRGSRLWSQGGV